MFRLGSCKYKPFLNNEYYAWQKLMVQHTSQLFGWFAFFPFLFFNVLTFQANLPFCNTNGDRMLERRNAVKYLKLGKNPQDSADGANVALPRLRPVKGHVTFREGV